MALRLLKVLVPEEDESRVFEILDEFGEFPRWWSPVAREQVEIQALLKAEGNEPVLDALESRLADREGFRMTLLPVQATVPRIESEEEEEPGPAEPSDQDENDEGAWASARINREELYTTVSDSVETTLFYVTMTVLSAVVASAGILMDDVAVIIGAMVIAPLLGPNMALSFAITVGDVQMGRQAFRTSAAGAAVALGVALLLGLLLPVDPTSPEIASRTQVGFGNVALALAAGAAGVLSLTRGVAAGIVGVMVAVALLPPLAVAGLLMGDGSWELGLGAVLLVVANVACVNLAGIVTFLLQGVRPLSWWEEEGARRAALLAATAWAVVVLALLAVVWLTLEG